ncbi:MAG: response regulator [Chloroherpetonaceae bacterium]|nr:response regulator [Chloroherpetonaceae bacterium]
MYIEDDELRELYRVHATAHIRKIESYILSLERNVSARADRELHRDILRELHGFKGDSRMLGVTKAEELLHVMEEVFTILQDDSSFYTGQLFELLLQAVDYVRAAVDEAVQPDCAMSNTNAIDIKEKLADFINSKIKTDKQTADQQVLPQNLSISAKTELQDVLTDDIIHLPVSKLDQLMQQVSELVINQRQLQASIDEFSKFIKQLESQVEIQHQLQELQVSLANRVGQINMISETLQEKIQELQLISFDKILSLFPRMVRDLSRQVGKQIELEISGGECLAERKIVEGLKIPLIQIVRNAIDHGIESPEERFLAQKPPVGKIKIDIRQQGKDLIISITDDGQGLDYKMIKEVILKNKWVSPSEADSLSIADIQSYIFHPGFSTKGNVSTISGRGVGLDVVKEMIKKLNGQIQVISESGKGCEFIIHIKPIRSANNVLLVRTSDRIYGLPTENLEHILAIKLTDLHQQDKRIRIIWQGQSVTAKVLGQLIHSESSILNTGQYYCLIYRWDGRYCGVIADEVLDHQEVILKPKGAFFNSIPYLLGLYLLSNGQVCYILDIHYLWTTEYEQTTTVTVEHRRTRHILLVEDSVPIGLQLKRFLEQAGYEVSWARDGWEGFALYQGGGYDCIISDIEMPGCDGLELTRIVRSLGGKLPIILLTTLAKEQDRQRGLAMGANVYLTKQRFDQEKLIQLLEEIVQ